METINTELIIADMQTVEKAIPRVEKEVKGKKKEPADLEALKAALAVLERGETIFAAKDKDKLDMDRLRELSLLTAKPFIYVFNSDEGVLGDEAKQQELRDLVAPADAVFLDAKLESDLVELSEEEAAEMLEMAAKSGKSIAAMMRENERAHRSDAQISSGIRRIWQVMRDCMDRGLATGGTLPGGLSIRRRAAGIHEALKAGDKVKLEFPLGSSYLRQHHSGPILCIAGGSGLAPIKSIVETALAHGMKQPIHVYFGARGARDLYLVEHFETLADRHNNLSFTAVLSDTQVAPHRHGFVTDAVAEDLADFDGWKAYVAGPPPMVDAAMAMAFARGLRPEDMHADVFFTPEGQEG